jgi:hypothetical protein
MRKKLDNKFAIIIISLIVSGALLSGIFFQAYAADQYKLTVKVFEEANRLPVANANVSIYGPVNQSKLSGPDGIVVFGSVPTGNYLVITVAPTYTVKSSHSVLVDDNKTITLLFSNTKAFFTYSPAIITTKNSVYFDASLSNSSGVITSYDWDFGDGTIGTNRTIHHTFTKPGEYRVALTVTSTVGAAAYTQTIAVIQDGNNYFFLYFLLIPLFLPLLIFLLLRRRRYYVVIQARVPPDRKHQHCPGDDSDCENCKLTPC